MIEKSTEAKTKTDVWIGHSHTECFGEHQHTRHRCAICGKDLQLENPNEYAFSTVILDRVNICALCRKEHFKFECFY